MPFRAVPQRAPLPPGDRGLLPPGGNGKLAHILTYCVRSRRWLTRVPGGSGSSGPLYQWHLSARRRLHRGPLLSGSHSGCNLSSKTVWPKLNLTNPSGLPGRDGERWALQQRILPGPALPLPGSPLLPKSLPTQFTHPSPINNSSSATHNPSHQS